MFQSENGVNRDNNLNGNKLIYNYYSFVQTICAFEMWNEIWIKIKQIAHVIVFFEKLQKNQLQMDRKLANAFAVF